LTEYLRGPWTRLETYAGRFWLILSLLHHAADLEADLVEMPVASKDAAVGAWRLVEFFKSHARRVYSCLHEGLSIGPARGARLILRWIANHPKSEMVRLGELTRVYSSSNGYDREMLIQGACWLQQKKVLQAIADEGEDEGGGPNPVGRPRGQAWKINPRLTNDVLTV
jgi:hypothetical protein